MDRSDCLESSLSACSSTSSSSGSLVVPSMQSIKGSSRTNNWTGKRLQTGCSVEEITVGNVTVRAPFKNGKYGVQKILHNWYKAKETSVQVIVRRSSDEVAELQACIVPNESAGRKQYILRAIDDPNNVIGFVDRPESEFLKLQGFNDSIQQGRTYGDGISQPTRALTTLGQLLRHFGISTIFFLINIYFYLIESATSFTCPNNPFLKLASRTCDAPTSPSVVMKINSSALDQDIYNHRRECAEKDETIKELSNSLHSLTLFGSKRIRELEDLIRKKNTIIKKLKKDMMLLQQKEYNLTRPRRPTIATAMSNERQLPIMADNPLYSMDNSHLSSDSESLSGNERDPTSINQQHPFRESQGCVQKAKKIRQFAGNPNDHRGKPTNSNQKFPTPNSLKEKSLNVTTNVDSGSRRLTASLIGDSGNTGWAPVKSKDANNILEFDFIDGNVLPREKVPTVTKMSNEGYGEWMHFPQKVRPSMQRDSRDSDRLAKSSKPNQGSGSRFDLLINEESGPDLNFQFRAPSGAGEELNKGPIPLSGKGKEKMNWRETGQGKSRKGKKNDMDPEKSGGLGESTQLTTTVAFSLDNQQGNKDDGLVDMVHGIDQTSTRNHGFATTILTQQDRIMVAELIGLDPSKHQAVFVRDSPVLEPNGVVSSFPHEPGEEGSMCVDLGDTSTPMVSLPKEPPDEGAASKELQLAFLTLKTQYNPDVVAVLEPRISGGKADDFVRMSGFDRSFRVEAVGFKGGIWVLWKERVKLSVLICDKQYVHVSVKMDRENFLVTFVYASPNPTIRRSLWEGLNAIAQGIRELWIVGGDFNCLLRVSEKQGGSLSNWNVSSAFSDLLFKNDLHELQTDGAPFTWARPGIAEKLDRIIGNVAWMDRFQEGMVELLPRTQSDHSPLMVRCGKRGSHAGGMKTLCRGLVFTHWIPRPGEACLEPRWVAAGDMFVINCSSEGSCARCCGGSDFCGAIRETVMHVLRDYPAAKKIWLRLVPGDRRQIFFNLQLEDWLWHNLNRKSEGFVEDWDCFFGVTAWRIWSWRNRRTFEGVDGSDAKRVDEIVKFVGGIQQASVHEKTMRGVCRGWEERMIRWLPPPVDWVKINSDGSFNMYNGVGCAGGVVRDCHDRRLGGFMMKVGFCTITGSELWGLFQALQLAWDLGYKKVKAEVDNSSILLMVKGNAGIFGVHTGIVYGIRELLHRDWTVELDHVFREANFVADYLASLATLGPVGLQGFDVPPSGVRPWLQHDIIGVSYPRNVRL
ncbi:OLC1v1005787C1 [Oldenlandia corymbosa var. corymbosa]|uniref:OLC1v1005787C1 n=1 Tax=Oldenlandia corymbosa var. corymbosa TaxID=529605 RepID=A0AAV1DFR7_OLDCO|nr:OLC1v1005787C1 [Oldenlandia corymbosa var. corymbosa]